MKKLFLTASVLSLVAFTSCKSEKEKVEGEVNNAQENVTETVANHLEANKETVAKVADIAKSLPTFSDPKINEFVTKYSQWAVELQTAGAAEDLSKLGELTQKAVEFQKELETIKQSLTPEDAKKLESWTAEVQKELSK